MKKGFKLILLLLVVAVSTVELNAQVTIGSQENPPEGAVLYLCKIQTIAWEWVLPV